jgi:hypothetical protein
MTHEAIPQPNVSPAELMQAAEAVAQNGRRRVVHVRGKAVALVPQASRPRSRARVFTKNDPLWGIVGLINDDGPTDVSENVDKYLAVAYLDTHE